jgi:hypothetical protein
MSSSTGKDYPIKSHILWKIKAIFQSPPTRKSCDSAAADHPIADPAPITHNWRAPWGMNLMMPIFSPKIRETHITYTVNDDSIYKLMGLVKRKSLIHWIG